MAACASGASTASAVMCSAMGPCSGCSACTVTAVSGSASFLQPGKRANGSASALNTQRDRIARYRFKAAPGFRRQHVIVPISLFCSSSCQCPNHMVPVRVCKLARAVSIAYSPVFARILRRSHMRFVRRPLQARLLRRRCSEAWSVADFQPRWQTLDIERRELIARRLRFGIRFIQPGNQLPLRRGQRDFCYVAANLALLDLVLRREPVPHRNIERDHWRSSRGCARRRGR